MVKAEKSPAAARKRITLFDALLYAILILLSAVFLYPIWYCVISALSSTDAVQRELPLLLPKDITLQAFEYVFSNGDILLYYRNTIFYAVAGTAITLAVTALMAYPFVVDDFLGKKFFNLFMVIPMFFSGGLLPSYFLVTSLGLRNTVWAILLPTALTGYNFIIFRTFFLSIPASLREAAFIDGAGHYRVLVTIMLPLSKALLATIGLFSLVGKWNDWFAPFLYITKNNLKPIQLYLRTVLVTAEMTHAEGDLFSMMTKVSYQNIRCATVLITIAPILCVYPFLQKYFSKGILIGAVKS